MESQSLIPQTQQAPEFYLAEGCADELGLICACISPSYQTPNKSSGSSDLLNGANDANPSGSL